MAGTYFFISPELRQKAVSVEAFSLFSDKIFRYLSWTKAANCSIIAPNVISYPLPAADKKAKK